MCFKKKPDRINSNYFNFALLALNPKPKIVLLQSEN